MKTESGSYRASKKHKAKLKKMGGASKAIELFCDEYSSNEKISALFTSISNNMEAVSDKYSKKGEHGKASAIMTESYNMAKLALETLKGVK